MTRIRSEYRLRTLDRLPAAPDLLGRAPVDTDRDRLAQLMLDAYRGTIDDEGEELADAIEAIDHYLGVIDRDRSLVVERDQELIAACFVLSVDGTVYIDPVIVAAAQKGHGLGSMIVLTVLHGLAAGGVDEVGATITDGNEPSERLFARLGFTRVGAWD